MRLMNLNFCAEAATVISASNIDTNFPASNLKHAFRSKRIRTVEGTTTLAVVFDLVTTEDIDSVALFWPKEDGVRLSNTAVVKIQANATNTWTSPSVDQTLTIDNTYMVASHFFTANQNYRYWRVYIDDPGNANDFIELGVCWLGKGLAIPNAQNGFKFHPVDTSKVTKTDFGHKYVDQYPIITSLDVSYQYLTYEEIQIFENAFRINGISKPVLIAIDADGDVFNPNHYLVYGTFEGSIGESHVRSSILNLDSVTITEIS